MDILVAVLQFIVNEILSKPALLVGIIALVGLLFMRRSAGDVVSGTLKTILGFLIMSAGADLLSGTLTPLGAMVQAGFHLHGVVPTNEAIVGLAQKAFGTQTAAIMALGFVVNILLARFTPAKFVFLTGHHLLFMATLLAVVLGSAGITGVNQIILGALLLGTAATVLPALVHPFTQKVTEGAGFALGHFNTVGYIISSLIGKGVGKVMKDKSRSTEEIEVPEQLSFLRDSLVMTTMTVIVIYLILAIIAGPAAIASQAGGSNYLMYAFTQALTFGASVAIILMGVRMILAEIVPAFQGIAERIVPNALPALDCPTTFTFAPNAVVFGFISSLVGGIVGLFLMGPLGLALIIPGMVPHFFDGGTAGVYGNATGGRFGAILGAFINGLLITFLPALLLAFMGSLGLSNTTFGDADFALVGILSGLGSRTGVIGLYVIVIVALVVLVGLASLITIRGKRKAEEAEEAVVENA
ncbi:PTS system ascorbate-specific IIC component [Thermosporothrix hazakensis]|jgi:PTS system ascorbate-specific IIC component|uniref:Ascorbate-specific PTS system EIIC component n=2 Tax=Thermosporothrix TaxID=768650 RepID=A0A326U8I0_THEHA|nr:PTS ascorbate transporter subunit IIC [Thermosporothrix hazakensis]PZW32021.1 PTS system ascorbate-specific IIC component [Thermosporothrix hazakensis]BBH91506.1 PTS ascorbate transporter subunit IIC [Thermosporothrix sp. COM3]GCE49651.1 PTS ascorbate transporter subunit IIC [Thermosporothrix hazakensis]